MEWHRQLDDVGSPSAGNPMMRLSTILLLLCCAALFCSAQTVPQSEADLTSEAQHLFIEERWGEIVLLMHDESATSADLYYYDGVALAHLERWEDARKALLAGRRLQPFDERFLVELAGVEFR